MKQSFEGVSSDHVGAELEEAYAKIIGGTVRGGFGDKGIDIVNIAKDIPVVQVKRSWQNAEHFLQREVVPGRFIPVIVGDPGQITPDLKQEILRSIREYGGWVAHDIYDREDKLNYIADIRNRLTPPAPTKEMPDNPLGRKMADFFKK